MVTSAGTAAVRRNPEFSPPESGRFERLVADLASRFAGIGHGDIDQRVNESLAALREFAEADQCCVYTILDDPGHSCLTHRASAVAALPVGTVIEHRKVKPWLWDTVIRQKRPVSFASPQDLPPEAVTDRQYLASVGTHAAVYLPYGDEGTASIVVAVLFKEGRQRSWSRLSIEQLAVFGWMIANALHRGGAVAAQTRSRAQLDASRRFAHATLNALGEYVCVVSADGLIVEANDAWRSLGSVAGLSAQVGSVGSNLLHALEAAAAPNDSFFQGLALQLRHLLTGGSATFEMESARAASKGVRSFKVSAHRFVANDQKFVAISLLDISERRSSDDELSELRSRHWHADRVTRAGVLIASLAHELCQPLGAILSNAQAALRFIGNGATPDIEEIREILSDIVADDKRAGRVIESLRLMIRRQETNRRPIDMAVVVRDVVGLLHTEFITNNVEVEQHCEEGCIAVVDRAQIQQVLINLILNGVEAMEAVVDEPRRLRLAVSRLPEGGARIEVSDAGVGFTQESLQKAFEAFWTTKSRGTGLGLAICHSIVSAHGGHIWVEPHAGAGTTIVVALPGKGLAI
jgi:signal transduction histidine kinase